MKRVPSADQSRIAKTLVSMWASILQRAESDLNESSDFFAEGGHSLAAMLLVARIKNEFQKSIPLYAVVENPTISALARYISLQVNSNELEERIAPDGSKTQAERLLGYHSEDRRALRQFWFEHYYAHAVTSRAHATFCERTYGANFCQHGMADLDQLMVLLSELSIKEGDTILDVGCGYGLIANFIQERTGAKVVGIDLSSNAIQYAKTLVEKNPNLEFHRMDVNDLHFEPSSFTHVISVDTIYFFSSIRWALTKFLQIGKPGVRVGILRTFPIRSFTAETWDPARTELAACLREVFGSFEITDLSKEENAHWALKLKVLEELKDEFIKEGNEELFNFRHSEAEFEAGMEQFRYMFIAG